MTTGIETTIALAILARIAPAQAATAARGIGAGIATLATGLRTRSAPGSVTMMPSAGAGRTSGGAEAGMALITAPARAALPATTTGVTTAAEATGATTTAAMVRAVLGTGAAATAAKASKAATGARATVTRIVG